MDRDRSPSDESDDDPGQATESAADGIRIRQPNPKVVLDLEAAEEVADLIMDEPGDADEDLLDQVLDALHGARPSIDPEDQRRAARGDVVAVEMSPDAARAVEQLIVEDRSTMGHRLRRLGGRIRAKVSRARRRRR